VAPGARVDRLRSQLVVEHVPSLFATKLFPDSIEAAIRRQTLLQLLQRLTRLDGENQQLTIHILIADLNVLSCGNLVQDERCLDLTDSLISWCKSRGMYVFLDLHAAPGGQGNDLNISDRDPSKPSLWQSEAAKKKTIALWTKLASRYANEPAVGGYDILNEPNWGFEDTVNDLNGTKEQKNIPLRQLLIAITRAIRSVDQKHLVIIEGNGWGNNYKGVVPPWDGNMVLSFHKYWTPTTQESIEPFLRLREQYDMPLWNGESGENNNGWYARAVALQEKNGIGWAWWPLKKIGAGNPLEIEAGAGYRRLSAYLRGEGEKPPAKAAFAALMQLAADSRFDRNVHHRDVVDALLGTLHRDKTMPLQAQ